MAFQALEQALFLDRSTQCTSLCRCKYTSVPSPHQDFVVSLTRDGDAAEEGEFVVGQEAALGSKQNLKIRQH